MGPPPPGPNAKQLNVEFSDTNRVTYFERLSIRKFKDGSVVAPQPGRVVETEAQAMEEGEEEEEEEGEERRHPKVTKYNVFYDPDDMELESEETQADPHYDYDFTQSKDLSSDDSSEQTLPSSNQLLAPTASSTVTVEEVETSIVLMSDSDFITKPEQEELTESNKPQDLTCKDDEGREEGEVSVRQASQQPGDLSSAVKAAWASSVRSSHDSQQMMGFFLHGVKSQTAAELAEPPPAEKAPEQENFQFKLGSTLWLPSSSSTQFPEITDQDPTPPPLPLSARPPTRDCYYDEDSDSDSEGARDEREAFISSRLGMTHDSITQLEGLEPMTAAARPGSSYQELEEEEEKMERDRADCETLDDLAWELASTIECEGRLTRCEGELEEEEGEEGQLGLTEAGGEPEPGEELYVADVGEVDMTKVISEFELYQQELLEEDCAGNQ